MRGAAANATAVRGAGELAVAGALDELAVLRAPWLACLEGEPAPSPNAHPDRFALVVRELGRELERGLKGCRPHVVLYSVGGGGGGRGGAGGGRAAMLLGRVERRRLRLAGGFRGPVLGCLDVIRGGVPGSLAPSAAAVLRAHLDDLLISGAVDLITIHALPAGHPFLAPGDAAPGDATPTSMGPGGPEVTPTSSPGPPSMQGRPVPRHVFSIVPGSRDGTLRQLSRKRRHEVRREDRLLERHFAGALEARELRDPGDVDLILGWRDRIVAGSWKSRVGAGLMRPSLRRGLLEWAAGAGLLRAFFLLGGGEPIAFKTGTAWHGVLHLEDMGFRPLPDRRLSPGKILLLRVIEHLCDEGDTTAIDYGIGDAGYKRVFGTDRTDEITLRLYGPSARGRAARRLDGVSGGVGAAARRLLAVPGLRASARRSWRARLARAARTRPSKSA